MAMKRSLREQFQKARAEAAEAAPAEAPPAEAPPKRRRARKAEAATKPAEAAPAEAESTFDVLAAVDEMQDLTRRLVETEERITELRAKIAEAVNG